MTEWAGLEVNDIPKLCNTQSPHALTIGESGRLCGEPNKKVGLPPITEYLSYWQLKRNVEAYKKIDFDVYYIQETTKNY